MKNIRKIIKFLKKELIQKEIIKEDTLNLAETLDFIKYWQEYRVFYKTQFFKINPFDVILSQNGKLYFKENNKEITEIGLIKESLFIYDQILEKIIEIDFSKFAVENKFFIKGIKLSKSQKETLNNKFFLEKISKKQNQNFNYCSIEKYM